MSVAGTTMYFIVIAMIAIVVAAASAIGVIGYPMQGCTFGPSRVVDGWLAAIAHGAGLVPEPDVIDHDVPRRTAAAQRGSAPPGD